LAESHGRRFLRTNVHHVHNTPRTNQTLHVLNSEVILWDSMQRREGGRERGRVREREEGREREV
jgi:hypothetical protein